MEQMNEKNLRMLQQHFIGKILAGFTHEIKNYLAIIKESAGLMDDLITLRKDTEGDSVQYLELIHLIDEQIEKANVLFRYLNRFAHRMDNQFTTFNVNESLEELTALVTRFANQKKINLEKNFLEAIPSVNSNPSLLQFVVYSTLEEEITKLDKNSKITIQTDVTENSVRIRMVSEGNFVEGKDDTPSISYEILEKIIKQLSGHILQGKETLITIPIKTL